MNCGAARCNWYFRLNGNRVRQRDYERVWGLSTALKRVKKR
jgi:hypothetical protein